MYNKIKLIAKRIIPKKALFAFEPCLRLILLPFYNGVRFQCNICNRRLHKFIHPDDEDKLCPFCGSLSRSRRLWHILTSEFFGEPLAILDFSPSRSLYRALKRKADVNYTSTDISGDFLSDYQFDITDIACENDKYDLIICYHILEHVENDERAMSELYRVLRKGGSCLIQTPFKDGNIYEDPSIITETERLKHFGQKDHVRVYSPDSLKQRLVSCGFQVVVKQYKEVEENEFGFKTDEQVIFCTK